MSLIQLFDIPIQNITMSSAVEQITTAANSHETTSIYFINAHCINVARNDVDYQTIIKNNVYNYADGIGIKLAANAFGIPLTDNVNGTDMFPLLCDEMQRNNLKVYFLGASQERLDALIQNTQQKYPNLNIAGHHHGFFTGGETQSIIQHINECKPDVLLAALGVPKQEKWIDQYKDQLNVPVLVGVGGLFDFYSGAIPRAPLWMRRIGMEWLFRFYQEPARLWQRYLIGNITFLLYVLYWKYRQPSD